MKFFLPWTVAFCFLVSSFLPAAENVDENCSVMRILVKYAYNPVQRDPLVSKEFFSYKNTARISPQEILLDPDHFGLNPAGLGPQEKEELNRLRAACEACKPLQQQNGNYVPTSLYHARVLTMKMRDHVTIVTAVGPKKFTLGKFLGAGGATHVWEIEGQSDRVLRIGFSPSGYTHIGGGGDSRKFIEIFVEQYAKRIEGIKAVTLFEYGKGYEYAVVSKVFGEEKASEFLDEYTLYRKSRSWWKRIFSRNSAVEAEYVHKFSKLKRIATLLQKDSYERMKKLFPHIEMDFPINEITDFRWDQFIWDKREQDWVEVDWE